MKPVLWVGSSRRDLLDMPDAVRRSFGHALFEAQLGLTPVIAKVLRGFGSAGVLELIENDPGEHTGPCTPFASPEQCMFCIVFKRNPRAELPPRGGIWP